MNAVVDSSVLVAALIDASEYGAWAEDILAGGSLHAPELVYVETTNILPFAERIWELRHAITSWPRR